MNSLILFIIFFFQAFRRKNEAMTPFIATSSQLNLGYIGRGYDIYNGNPLSVQYIRLVILHIRFHIWPYFSLEIFDSTMLPRLPCFRYDINIIGNSIFTITRKPERERQIYDRTKTNQNKKKNKKNPEN
jgi:hypothetical protein